MAVKACHSIHMILSVCFAAVLFAIAACSGGYHTTHVNDEKKVYRVDEYGAKTLVYETDQHGKTTIKDTDDPMAKRQPAAQEIIYVSLAPPVLDAQMQKAERSKGAVAEQIRNELEADPNIRLIEENGNRSGLLKPHGVASADVEVLSKVSLKEAYGIDRKTGKPSKALAVVFEATITSQVPSATYNVSESGHAVRNLEVSKRFAKQIKQVILEKIGPGIAAR
jgi:hypothetical protein